MVAERNSGDRLLAGNLLRLRRGKHRRHDMNSGMAARILVAFVDLQHRPCGTVQKRRQERRPALADATGSLQAFLRKANLGLTASGDDGAQAIEHNEPRACHSLGRKRVIGGFLRKPRPGLQPFRGAAGHKLGCGLDARGHNRHVYIPR